MRREPHTEIASTATSAPEPGGAGSAPKTFPFQIDHSIQRSKEKILRISGKAVRAVAACTAVGAIVAVGAGSAVAATWDPSAPIKETGTLTLKLAGGSPKACQVNLTGGSSPLFIAIYAGQTASCEAGPGGTSFTMNGGLQEPRFNGSQYSVVWTFGGGNSPYGGWGGANLWVPSWTGVFTNPFAVPATNAKIRFANTLIGHLSSTGQPLTLSGALDVTTSTGGAVRINP